MSEVTDSSPPETHAVGHFSVKAPPFYTKCPESWFLRLESQFVLAKITHTETQYHHVLASLPEDISMNVSLPTKPNYAELKKNVLDSLKKNRHVLIEEALSTLELGDRRPTQLVRDIQRRFNDVGIPADDDLIKSRLLSAMPDKIKSSLVGHESCTLEQFAKIADSMMAVASVGSCTPFTVGHVEENKQFHNKSNSRPTLRTQVKAFYDGQRPMICNAHIFYAHRARSCRPWCRWPKKPQKILKDFEKTPSQSRAGSPTNC